MVAPLTPPTCDLRDFPYLPLQIARLKQSRSWLLCKRNPALAFYLLNTWTAAYHSVPAGSLEDDDLLLADIAMCDDDTWSKIKNNVLRGWVKADDGRLYNPTVSEQALEAWLQKLGQRKGTAAAAAKRTGAGFNAEPFDHLIADALVHLQTLNPNSRLLTRRGIVSGGAPGGDPGGAPGGRPREEKGREGNLYTSEGKPSEALLPSDNEPPNPPSAPFAYDPSNPIKTMFHLGKQLWGERQGGSLVGKLRKVVDDDGETAGIMRDIAQDMGPEDGKSYLMGIVKSRERSAELTPRDRGDVW